MTDSTELGFHCSARPRDVYRLEGGARVLGLHVDDVEAALETFIGYGQSSVSARDRMAHALAAAQASRERRAIKSAAERRRVERVHGGSRV